MKVFDKRLGETLGHIQVFRGDHPELFVKDSPAGRVFEELQAAAEVLAKHQSSQMVSKEDGKVSTAERAAARMELTDRVDTVSRTAETLNLSDFWSPRQRGDHGLIEVAKVFVSRAEPLKQKFIDSQMPPDFIDRLNAAIRRLEKAIATQASRTNSRLTATSEIERARNEAMSILDRLDAMMENKLGSDSPLFKGWNSARRIERYGRPKRGGKTEAGKQEDPATTKTNAHAA